MGESRAFRRQHWAIKTDLYLGSGSHNSFGVPVDPASLMDLDSPSIDIPYLDNYANTSWETILHYLVGSSLAARPSDAVLLTLKNSGLMSGSGTAARNLKITSKGFQFLLEDVNSQLWNLLLRYLAAAEEKDMDLVEVLAFLFMLGSLELGRVRGLNCLDAYADQTNDEITLGLLNIQSFTFPDIYVARPQGLRAAVLHQRRFDKSSSISMSKATDLLPCRTPLTSIPVD